jgi:hypothetical protein
MGVGYGKEITHWSRGEFPFADNPMDEIATIRTYLHAVGDDFGNSIAAAAAYTPGEPACQAQACPSPAPPAWPTQATGPA